MTHGIERWDWHLIDLQSTPHVAPLALLLLELVDIALLCALVDLLGVCEGPPPLPVGCSHLQQASHQCWLAKDGCTMYRERS